MTVSNTVRPGFDLDLLLPPLLEWNIESPGLDPDRHLLADTELDILWASQPGRQGVPSCQQL
jgi:hypothetical protein